MSIKSVSIEIEKLNYSPSQQNQNENCTFQSNLYNSFRAHVWLFPLVSALMLPAFCFTLYSYAAYHGHLEPILQFVSDSGTYVPSAGYFAEGIDIMAILVFIASYARYKQVKYYLQVKIPEIMSIQESKCSNANPQLILLRLNKLNFTTLLCAFVNLIMMIGLANFRVDESFHMHAFSGITMFIATFTYTWCMIGICEQLTSKFGLESRPFTMRFGVILQAVALVGCVAFNAVGTSQFGFDRFFNENERLHWTSDQPGYWWHVMGTGCEWIVLNCNSILLVCLYRRMKQFKEWHQVDL